MYSIILDMVEDISAPKIGISDNGNGKEVQESITGTTTQGVGAKLHSLSGTLPIRKFLKGFGLSLIFLFITTLITILFTFRSSKVFISSVEQLAQAGNSGNLEMVRSEISNVKKSIVPLKVGYALLSWTKIVPVFGNYTKDLGRVIKASEASISAGTTVLNTIEPHLGILGFTAANGEKTTEERIQFIVAAIPSLMPEIEAIANSAAIVEKEILAIDPNRYPNEFRGKELRPKIKNYQGIVASVAGLVVNGKSVIQSLPYLLGMDSPRNYLILFQNDKELRPTGGFMTGYAIMRVDKAKVSPVSTDDIYNLDAKYKPSIPAPEPLIKYIQGPYVLSENLRLRDMNWSPDFEVSMDMFTQAANEAGVGQIDGIIAVDTEVVVRILDVIGPIGVPGFGEFSTKEDPECKCPQVIHELESFADVEGPIVWDPVSGEIVFKPKNADNRKRIIGPLMNSIVANSLGQPKEKLPALFMAGLTSLTDKHVLFYMFDDEVHDALSSFGLTGRIKDYDGDYLHVSDANLGGRKSNLYVTHEVEQEITVMKDGSVEKTVTLTYNNPQKYDGWLNSVLPNWVRVYVPKGSELIAVEGLEDKADPYEDLGKTVFSGLFQLRPEGVAKVTFKYNLPMIMKNEYKLLIQSQPGTHEPLYTVKLGKHNEEFPLKTDKELKIKL